jgi:hypothetical protein
VNSGYLAMLLPAKGYLAPYYFRSKRCVMLRNRKRITEEAIMTYFKVIFQHSYGETEENPSSLQARTVTAEIRTEHH